MAASSEGRRARRGGAVARCIKCREAEAAALVNQTEAMCVACLHAALLGKFKSAVNCGKIIQRGDHVLLAFSGGPASRCALEFLLSIQSPLLQSRTGDLCQPLGAQGAAARGRIPFRLSIGHVDERVAVGEDLLPRGSAERLAGEMLVVVRDAVARHRGAGAGSCADADADADGDRAEGTGGAQGRRREGDGGRGEQHGVGYEVIALEDALGDMGADRGNGQGKDGTSTGSSRAVRLAAVLGGVADSTGREDLVEVLRLDALHLLAHRLGCTKIVVGTTVTRMAARVIAGTAKGEGFSLPADLASVDTRRGVPVLRPLAACSLSDLALLAHLLPLPTLFLPSPATRSSLSLPWPPRIAPAAATGGGRGGGGGGVRVRGGGGPPGSINWLAAALMARLQSDNSGRQFTVTRTALKLQPFPFNVPPSLAPPPPAAAAAESSPLPLCAVCLAPLPPPPHNTPTDGSRPSPPAALCCSCRWGVVGAAGNGRQGRRGEGGAGREREADGVLAVDNGEGGHGEGQQSERGEGGSGCEVGGSEGAGEKLLELGLPAGFVGRGRTGSDGYMRWLRHTERSMIEDCLLEAE